MTKDRFEVVRLGQGDRCSLSCRRIEARPSASHSTDGEQIVCFLPWLLNHAQCREARLLPPETWIAYEMPHAIVSPSPENSVQALRIIVDDFLQLIDQRKLDPARLTLLGLSIGNFAATYLANLTGARLWSIASGDRGEVLLWSSAYASGVRRQAEARGYGFADFAAALRDFNPINNLRNIAAGSTFIAGRFDRVVPYRSAMNVAAEARSHNPATCSIVLPLGHTGTLFAGVQYLRLKSERRKC